MAPQAAMKRPAAAAASSRPAKRGAVEDQLSRKCGHIADAIKDSSSLPEHVKLMLAAGLGSCLKTYKQDRHEYQTKFLDMVAEALEEVKASTKNALVATEAKIAGSSQEKEVREKALADAQATLQQALADQEEKHKSYASEAEAVKAATTQKKAALSEQASSEKALDEAAAKKAKLESNCSPEALAAFKEKAAPKAAVNNFVKICLEAGFEKSLLDTMPSVFSKKPEERGTFGNVCIEQLESAFAQKMNSFAQSLDELTQAKTERAEAVAAAERGLVAATEKRDISSAAQLAAVEAVKEAKASLSAAQKAVNDFAPELEAAQRENERAVAMLKDLEAGPLADFAELIEHAPPKETVDKAAEEAGIEAEGDGEADLPQGEGNAA